MKTVLGLVILAVAVGAVYVLNDVARDEEGMSLLHVANELEIEIDTARPEQRGIVRSVQTPGEVEAYAEVDIAAEIVAKILEMPVDEGSVVREGDLLCHLDDADYRARVLSAEANVGKLEAMLTQAKADLDKAQRDCDRQVRLSESAATSPTELADYHTLLISAQAVYDMRRHELIEAQAALQSAKEDLAKTVIKAPLSGVVSQLFAKQGEVVVTGTMNNPGTRIMVISDLSKMVVRCRVAETDAPLVAPGQAARIYLQSDTRKSIAGEVRRVATKGSKPEGRDVVTFETLVLITADDERVKPGMTANVDIEVARKDDALTIPIQAVVYRKRRDIPEKLIEAYDKREADEATELDRQTEQYLKLVYCVEDGKAVPRLVRIGISDAIRTEIVDGVAQADTVVIGPYRSLDLLKEGSAVKPREENGTKAKGEEEATAVAGSATDRDTDKKPDEEKPQDTQARADGPQ